MLVPVRPSGADIWASEWLVGAIRNRQRMTGGVPAAAFVISQQIVGTNLAGEIGDVLGQYDLPILEGRTSQRVAYAEALSVGSTVLDMEPDEEVGRECAQSQRRRYSLHRTLRTTMSNGTLHESAQTPDPHQGDRDVEAAHRKMEALRAMEEVHETKRLNAEVPADLYDRFKAKCEREDRSMSEVLREFLHVYTTD